MTKIKKEDFKELYKEYQTILNDYRDGVYQHHEAENLINELERKCKKNEIPFIPSKRALDDIIPINEDVYEESSYDYEYEESIPEEEEEEPDESYTESY